MTDQPTRTQRLFGGWAALGIGVLSLVMMYLHPEQLRVPAWVAYAAMSSFVCAGGALLTGESAATRTVAPWLGVLATIALMVPAVWIAFGPGPRNCAAALAFFSTTASDWVCRGVFGFGALIGLLILFLMIASRFSATRTR